MRQKGLPRYRRPRILRLVLLAVGAVGLVAAVVTVPTLAGAAASQDWPAFVLVTGLLLLGRVARDDGLFDAGGVLVARVRGAPVLMLFMAAALVAAVTSLLNLDTAVVFVTPVLVIAARHRGVDEEPMLYLAVFLANSASILLPGSNLTNLIVLGSHGDVGGSFALRMAPAWIASVVVTVAIVTIWARGRLATPRAPRPPAVRPHFGAGILGVAVATSAMVLLGPAAMAVVVALTGAAAAGWRVARGRLGPSELPATVDAAALAGLFAVAVALGALGRSWDGPSALLAHASSLETAVVGALTSVVVNNLPAASLLAARPVGRAESLLIGLNLGPNLAVTGALSALLWFQAARSVDCRPSAARFSRLGLLIAPLSIAAALGALALFG